MNKPARLLYRRSVGYDPCEGMIEVQTARALAAQADRALFAMDLALAKAEHAVQEIRFERAIAFRDATQCKALLHQHKRLPAPCIKFLTELHRAPRPRYVDTTKVPQLLKDLGFITYVPNTLGFMCQISPAGKQKMQKLGLIPAKKKVKR